MMARSIASAGMPKEKPLLGLAPGSGSGLVKGALVKKHLKDTRTGGHSASLLPVWSDDRRHFQGFEVAS